VEKNRAEATIESAQHKEMPGEMTVTRSFVSQKKEVTKRSTAVLPSSVLSVIFFDAAGTLFRLPKSVGYHYALVGKSVGLKLSAPALDHVFAEVWKETPGRPPIASPREDDDKSWWRKLVDRVLDGVATDLSELDRDAFFEVAYAHFAEVGVWELFPEVREVLESLGPRFTLAIISNFDGRLRMILEQLGISKLFRHVFISSELGVDKPNPLIYSRALNLGHLAPNQVLHVGNDPERDWNAAEAAGLGIFRLNRPHNSLLDLLAVV
jgi:putative hydrolase of the HAD superfamily